MRALSGHLDRYEISVRTYPDRGGPVSLAVHGDDASALKTSTCRHILLFIHGFNNTASAADASYAEMIGMLEPVLLKIGNGPDALVCFQWPGDAVVVESVQFLDAVGYPVDIQRAQASAAALRTYLEELSEPRAPNFRISLIGHSLGCRLALELMKIRPGQPRLPMEVVALMAGAVPVSLVDPCSSWAPTATLAWIDGLARSMLKFHSWLDAVLGIAFPAGQSLAFSMGIEPGEFLEAVGYFGDPPSFAIDQPTTYDSHGGYWSDHDVAASIAASLDLTIPPPSSATVRPERQLRARTLASR